MKKDLLVAASESLKKLDTEHSTYGCRHSNPDICSNNGITNKCAFYSDDYICKNPPRSWKRQYISLLEEKGDKR